MCSSLLRNETFSSNRNCSDLSGLLVTALRGGGTGSVRFRRSKISFTTHSISYNICRAYSSCIISSSVKELEHVRSTERRPPLVHTKMCAHALPCRYVPQESESAESCGNPTRRTSPRLHNPGTGSMRFQRSKIAFTTNSISYNICRYYSSCRRSSYGKSLIPAYLCRVFWYYVLHPRQLEYVPVDFLGIRALKGPYSVIASYQGGGGGKDYGMGAVRRWDNQQDEQNQVRSA